jgi:hypothetical protein
LKEVGNVKHFEMEDSVVTQALANMDSGIEEAVELFCNLSLEPTLKQDAATKFAQSLLTKLGSVKTYEEGVRVATQEFGATFSDQISASAQLDQENGILKRAVRILWEQL